MSGEKVYATASFLQSRDAFDKRPLQPRQRIQTPGNRQRVLPNWQRMRRPDVWTQAASENLNARQPGRRYSEAGDLKISCFSAVQAISLDRAKGEENG
ncbi:MAG: hypothetical protein EOQ86_01600 [Mesorhizobium sp.]|uniref:hypothetical protein n=1 Tax=Mesorhizobium sp. TaxID=1871066 RepID=UPI000FE60F19|nr:hypothetical protein [Mesorhizobium sp.]RWH84463.1 MAG: hypothetical protein EOQ85_02590 [Mesorhizobium sp.]RWH86851.1 MAG: hypothetical protein EOQ86_01600 [Mesorhizobium sp.]RWH93612.1 MAG: hypothetical protein EOQ87_03530 [Mesorhizobium sp.]RWI02931.1 MAG: hypothetical protein EOQ88_01600 [Mesorhizobium sp.]RWI05442.1 MAG: hypothetical protein EOQ89_05645 [Mesorhizobium sp.]